jgi:hypothetical protein
MYPRAVQVDGHAGSCTSPSAFTAKVTGTHACTRKSTGTQRCGDRCGGMGTAGSREPRDRGSHRCRASVSEIAPRPHQPPCPPTWPIDVHVSLRRARGCERSRERARTRARSGVPVHLHGPGVHCVRAGAGRAGQWVRRAQRGERRRAIRRLDGNAVTGRRAGNLDAAEVGREPQPSGGSSAHHLPVDTRPVPPLRSLLSALRCSGLQVSHPGAPALRLLLSAAGASL